MIDRTYLLAFNTADPALDLDAVKSFIREGELFTHWWNHLPGVFLVTATGSAEIIASRVHEVAGSSRFLVIAVEPGESEGWLSEKGWDWIRRRSKEAAVTSERRQNA